MRVAENLEGRTFGKLTVIGTFTLRGSNRLWNCRCECGEEKLCNHYLLLNKKVSCCGCTKQVCLQEIKDSLEGQTFNRLTVLSVISKKNCLCLCKCGNQKELKIWELKNGHVKSCGCLHKEQLAERNKSNAKHNMFGTSIYSIWSGIVQRCTNPNSPSWSRYGGRGITISDEWRNSFEQFYLDMGTRPEGTSLDRIDNNGNYCKENCKWSTAKEQSRNRRDNRIIKIENNEKTLSEWAEISGLRSSTLARRIALGWDLLEAISIPVRPQRRKKRI